MPPPEPLDDRALWRALLMRLLDTFPDDIVGERQAVLFYTGVHAAFQRWENQ